MGTAEKILTKCEKFHICLGLERVSKVLEIFGNPQDELEFIHVAGTNGKGSVCAILSSILCEHFSARSGKVGLFTSPHLFSYTERIKINNVEISAHELDKLVVHVDETAQKNSVNLTEFEILTVAGFLYFKEARCDIVVLETGLGGRLDATNVIKQPLTSVITSIGLDHTARLGDTIEKIGFEKAGIIKEGCPVIVGVENLALSVIQEVAVLKKASLHKVECVKPPENFALSGDFQTENLTLALAVLNVLPFCVHERDISAGLVRVRHKFRMEYDPKRNLLIDGCHNPDGARALREFLDKNFADRCVKFIYGTLNNKDWRQILDTLYREGDELLFYEFKNENCLKFEELPQKFKMRARKIENPLEEINALQSNTLTVACGSLYMLGEIFRETGK